MAGEFYRLRRLLEYLSKKYEGHKLYCKPSLPDARNYQYLHLVGVKVDEQPAPIDYRPDLPPVFDQGKRGTCVACAAGRTLKAYQEIQQGDYPDNGLSVAFLYSMCKKIDGEPNEEGTTLKAAMRVLQKNGICAEDLMPYTTITSLPEPKVPAIPSDATAAAEKFRIQTYAQLCAVSDLDRSQTIFAMRQALKKEGPFIMALLVCQNFKPDADGVIPKPSGQLLGGHGVGIVGDLPDKKCLILRNSWGASWGLNGYAYLPYTWITEKSYVGWYIFEAWTATDLQVNKNAGRIEITPGARTMLADGIEVKLDQPAVIDRCTKRTLLPVRALAENMGYAVSWDGKKVILTRNN